jgi:hypothetical protein
MFLVIFIMFLSTVEKEAMGIEKPKYEVLEKDGRFELRQYSPHIVAETEVGGAFNEVTNEGFRRLLSYIKGNNKLRASISMTAPVSQEASSENISMTAPVSQQKQGETWRITFLMPAKYTMDTLPEPLDKRVVLKQEPPQLIAALRYSGSWSKHRFEKNEARLRAFIEKLNLTTCGETIFARYNPPFLPGFLRRNEVLIPVRRHSDQQLQKRAH